GGRPQLVRADPARRGGESPGEAWRRGGRRCEMNRLARMVFAAVLPLVLASPANSQVINLLVGNQTSFNALDRYAYPSGLYQGAFAGPGTGPPGAFLFTYGPDGNIYLERNVPHATILKYDGHTGNPLGTFVSDPGAYFTFGPDGNVSRLYLLG